MEWGGVHLECELWLLLGHDWLNVGWEGGRGATALGGFHAFDLQSAREWRPRTDSSR